MQNTKVLDMHLYDFAENVYVSVKNLHAEHCISSLLKVFDTMEWWLSKTKYDSLDCQNKLKLTFVFVFLLWCNSTAKKTNPFWLTLSTDINKLLLVQVPLNGVGRALVNFHPEFWKLTLFMPRHRFMICSIVLELFLCCCWFFFCFVFAIAGQL